MTAQLPDPHEAETSRSLVGQVGYWIYRLPANALLGFIWLWQKLISPLYGDVCRYHPSCSHYGAQAIRKHGAIKGSVLTMWRILRCNPWSAGGPDEVPPKGDFTSIFRRQPPRDSSGIDGDTPQQRITDMPQHTPTLGTILLGEVTR